ncbi:hypothetical protein ACIBLA_06900 [Streptomyces sp. NPDC050433]|uniref:hypothetical protein n=1 Tax=unclassified Streptomyces TaxID=2593676 RepID=UPI00343ABAAC
MSACDQRLLAAEPRASSGAAGRGERGGHAVVHVTRRVPIGGHWQRLDAVVVLDSRYADAVVPLLGEAAGGLVAGLAQGEIALFRPTGADVPRLDIAPAETALTAFW